MLNTQTYSLPGELQRAVTVALDSWQNEDKTRRLWAKDASVWTSADEAKWLGWLDIVEGQLNDASKFIDLANEVDREGFSHALLLGMGGSSLAPEVLAMTFGRTSGYPEFHILDSTVPAQVRAVAAKIDLDNTLFFVSSKSGSTLEPNIFKQYFFERVAAVVGHENAGNRFIAITDPESKMQKVAETDSFRKIFFGLPTIGGRYSALSDFGMIPAASMGLDVMEFLGRTNEMVKACGANVAATENPGVVLGTILGVGNSQGRDKLTIIAAPEISDLGAWLEQLIAESTGKIGKSIIPLAGEFVASPETYGNDRIFAYLTVENGEGNNLNEQAVAALEAAGQPVVRIVLTDKMNLGQEFFRWEIATAVAGAVMNINPFDQPDVEASKIETRRLTDAYEETGSLPDETPFFEENGIKLFSDEQNANELKQLVGGDESLRAYLQAHLNRLQENDYFATLAYVEMNTANAQTLEELRTSVMQNKRVATCLGFGPRFLHSTGQGYKGGANNGVFLQITSDDAEDLSVPDQKFTFGIVKAAQARGDFQVLIDRQRRALRVHLGADVPQGLKTLRDMAL